LRKELEPGNPADSYLAADLIVLRIKMSQLYSDMINRLNGLRLNIVGAAADMLWISFGEQRTVADLRGKPKQVGEWALHLQCPWRFVRGGEVILASSDCYYDAEGVELLDFDSEATSMFKKNAKDLNALLELSKVTVRLVLCSEAGAFELLFDDLKLTVLPTESENILDQEAWRLFQPSTDSPHFVFPQRGEAEPVNP